MPPLGPRVRNSLITIGSEGVGDAVGVGEALGDGEAPGDGLGDGVAAVTVNVAGPDTTPRADAKI